MKYLKQIVILILFFVAGCNDDYVTPDFISNGVYEGEYFPTAEWKYCSPEEVGVNSKLLVKAISNISDSNYGTEGYLIIKDGYIIAEDYFRAFTPGQKHISYSVAKSFTSAVIGIAIDKGFIHSVDDSISEYYTKLNNDTVQQWKKALTIENLLTMTSGIQWSESGISNNDLFQMATSNNFVDYVLNKPVEVEPGTRWSYNSGESMLLSGIINITTGKSMLEFAEENLLQPIGINEINWLSDSKNHTIAGWGISAAIEDYARFGYLYLHNGNWDGNQIVSEQWINESTTPFRNETPFYGYLWWLSNEAFEKDMGLPNNLFMARGAFGQYIIVIPSENMVIVRVGNDINWNAEDFIQLVLDAA